MSTFEELPPITRRLTGIVSLPGDKTDRELIEEALLEKHMSSGEAVFKAVRQLASYLIEPIAEARPADRRQIHVAVAPSV